MLLITFGSDYDHILWFKDFLTNQLQSMRVGTDSPKGCVLSPLLYSLYTPAYLLLKKKIITDFRRKSGDPPARTHTDCVENTFKYIGTLISWTANMTVIRKAQQCLHFLKVPRKNKLDCKLLENRSRIDSIDSLLMYCSSAG